MFGFSGVPGSTNSLQSNLLGSEAGEFSSSALMKSICTVSVLTASVLSAEVPAGLEVSLNLEGVPSVGDSIKICVVVTNRSRSPRVLVEHVNAQLKEYNKNPQESFWKTQKRVHIKPDEGGDRIHQSDSSKA